MMMPYRPLSDQYTPAELKHYMERYHTNRAARLVGITHTNNHVYQVKDVCRIKLVKISNVMRRLRETHWGINRVALHFSPLRVMIHSVIPATRTRRIAYNKEPRQSFGLRQNWYRVQTPRLKQTCSRRMCQVRYLLIACRQCC